jgi:hypothetical protein
MSGRNDDSGTMRDPVLIGLISAGGVMVRAAAHVCAPHGNAFATAMAVCACPARARCSRTERLSPR